MDQCEPRKCYVVPEGEPRSILTASSLQHQPRDDQAQVLDSSMFLLHQICPWGSGAMRECLRWF